MASADAQGAPQATQPLALRPRDAARALQVSERTLWSWTSQGIVPHVRVGRAVLYPVDQLRQWMADRAAKGRGE